MKDKSALSQHEKKGQVKGIGKHFEINDSDYLNIILDSNNEINVKLESIPEMIILRIKRHKVKSKAISTNITISNLNPNTIYHKYEDHYNNHTELTTDESGNYSYNQDISKEHLIFIQPRASTIYLTEIGGWSSPIGTWDSVSRIATITQPTVTETIEIQTDNVILDGQGNTLDGNLTGSGIYLGSGRHDIIIKNLTIKEFSNGIYFWGYNYNNKIENTTIIDNGANGIEFDDNNSRNTITNNTISSNGYDGIEFYDNNNDTTITNNTISNNGSYGIDFEDNNTNTTIANNIITENGNDGIEFEYNNANTTIENNTINHNGFDGIEFVDNNTNTTIANNIITENEYEGIEFDDDNFNTVIDNNTITNNGGDGIEFDDYNTSNIIINNTITNNNEVGVFFYGHNNNNNIENNIITENVSDGIEFRYDNTKFNIINNTITNNEKSGIYFDDERNYNNIIEDNIISNNVENGIHFEDYDNYYNTIDNNIISNNEIHGIYFEDEENHYNTIENNTISDNGLHGIYFEDEDNYYNTIKNNTISNNTVHGIYFEYDDNYNNTIENNTISNNGTHGIYFEYDNNYENTIEKNIITDNDIGIIFEGIDSINNIIRKNCVINNTKGIHIETDNNNNDIEYNNFINSTVYNAYNDGDNYFDSNYWDDWSGTGPYIISPRGQDDNPLSSIYDHTPPTTTISLSGTQVNDWYTTEVQVTLSADDTHPCSSGVKETLYSLDGVDWNNYTGAFSISEEGIITIYYHSINNSGIAEEIKTKEVKIDINPPQIHINTPVNQNEYLLNQNVLADWSVTDECSGVESATGTVPCGDCIDTSSLGEKTFTVSATDNVDHTTTQTIKYYVKTITPKRGVMLYRVSLQENDLKIND